MKAFPQKYPKDALSPCTKLNPVERGMELRDYFAAKAMPTVFKFVKENLEEDGERFEICDPERDKEISTMSEVVAEECYILADAMMNARKR